VGLAQDIRQQLKESAPARAIDWTSEAVDKFLGPSGKAWMANGLDELRQVFSFGNVQVQPGNNPGLWGTITTGEATAERMGDLSLDDLRASAASRTKDDGAEIDRGQSQERAGREM